MKKVAVGIFIAAIFLQLILCQAFSIDTIFLKIALKEGESVDKIIKVETENVADFKIQASGLGGLLFIKDEREFSLKGGESKTLLLEFNDKNENYKPGVYVGKFVVSSEKKVKEVPIVVEIETKDVLFDTNLNIPLTYENIKSGEKLVVDVTVFNLEKIGMKTVKMNYAVKDFSGNTILAENENLAVETSALVTKTISLPKNIKPGNYVFIVTSEYKNTLGTSSYFFKVVERRGQLVERIERSSLYIIFITVLILLAIVFLVIYSIRKRDELFLELEKQHRREMRLQLRLLQEARETELKRLRGEEKKKKEEEFKRIEKEKRKQLRKEYRERKKQLKKLKRSGKKKEIERKLKEWERQGYDISYLKSKLEKPTQRIIEKKLKEWRRKGYDVYVLGK